MTNARDFLKYKPRLVANALKTDQLWGISPPSSVKPYSADAVRHDLTAPGRWKGIHPIDLVAAIRNRRSHRAFTENPLTMDDLSFLLWATQGVQAQLNQNTFLRTIPSAGARHALETYLFAFRVQGLPVGLYRYLPVEHQLLQEYLDDRLAEKLIRVAQGQSFVGRAAVTFVWTTIPYRMEWRYGEAAHKFIAFEAGHACQNLYLACEAIGAGTCAIAVYHQEGMDRLLGIDGKEEFAIYLAPVGRMSRRP